MQSAMPKPRLPGFRPGEGRDLTQDTTRRPGAAMWDRSPPPPPRKLEVDELVAR